MGKNTAKTLNVFIGCPGEFLIWPDAPPSAARPQQAAIIML
jgi:hypothetical protein